MLYPTRTRSFWINWSGRRIKFPRKLRPKQAPTLLSSWQQSPRPSSDSKCIAQDIGLEASNQIIPASTQSRKEMPDSHRIQSLTRRSNILEETLEVFFSMECLVATAYLEAAVPFFYGCYIVIMVFLPSARYHSEMTGITSENMGSKVQILLLLVYFKYFRSWYSSC